MLGQGLVKFWALSLCFSRHTDSFLGRRQAGGCKPVQGWEEKECVQTFSPILSDSLNLCLPVLTFVCQFQSFLTVLILSRNLYIVLWHSQFLFDCINLCRFSQCNVCLSVGIYDNWHVFCQGIFLNVCLAVRLNFCPTVSNSWLASSVHFTAPRKS